jgi:hypothetical protein
VSKTSYNGHELDSTRAYVVLAHAEIEAFCEEIASSRVQRAMDLYNQRGVVAPVLRRMVIYHVGKHKRSWGEVLTPSQSIIDGTFKAYRDSIKKNHGVKRANIESILYPLGITEAHLGVIWLAQMDSFGERRGGLAHSSVGATSVPDPLSEYTNVQQLQVYETCNVRSSRTGTTRFRFVVQWTGLSPPKAAIPVRVRTNRPVCARVRLARSLPVSDVGHALSLSSSGRHIGGCSAGGQHARLSIARRDFDYLHPCQLRVGSIRRPTSIDRWQKGNAHGC